MEFHVWMQQERKRRRMSQDELAERAGLTQTTISSIELGKSKPYKSTRQKIMAAFAYLTNGDVVRQMTDEELVLSGVICCEKINGGPKKADCTGDCWECKLAWLRQKTKGGKV